MPERYLRPATRPNLSIDPWLRLIFRIILLTPSLYPGSPFLQWGFGYPAALALQSSCDLFLFDLWYTDPRSSFWCPIYERVLITWSSLCLDFRSPRMKTLSHYGVEFDICILTKQFLWRISYWNISRSVLNPFCVQKSTDHLYVIGKFNCTSVYS